MASRSPRRSQRRSPRRRRGVLVCATAAAVALVISLVMMLRPDQQAGDGYGAATSAAGARVIVPPTVPEPELTPSPTPSATRSPSPKATPSTPAATPTVAAAPKPTPSAASGGAAARPVSGAAPLAGRIRPGTAYQGVATFYGAGNGDGHACSYGPSADVMTAAMNTTDYETSMACGAYVLVRAASGASVTVRITNECPGDCAPGQLDLSAPAFAKLADPVAGRIPITWSLLSPATAEPLSIRYKTGSSSYWCGIQVIGHRNPLARLEVRTGGGWVRLARTEYNYFLSEQGSGCGGAIRISDIYGEQLTLDGIAVRPDVVQPTRVQFAAH
ncbi:expansin EXLX1 family cellulose-binding protein [Streptomyces sp. ADMS]|uniref:expansin EXLX1 family cellulose-binding protein n=1 Tax=Streptomyces sp. ADMS TaxID=3071415 RepID=UPI00296EE17A|nr:expansin EXLX1 family cellulose-binding protein [Streptomyces sp. ADMS]MDW4910110.1 expansin EXLX1 family cellulose-binding protein [Streptomyces sp. ADMS]